MSARLLFVQSGASDLHHLEAVVVARRERISSHGPSTCPTSERLYGQRGRSSELRSRDMGEVTVAGSEHTPASATTTCTSRSLWPTQATCSWSWSNSAAIRRPCTETS